MMPKIVIVLATFNGQRFLQAQLQSIADQAGVDWQVIATDDGSHDGTFRILKQFAERYPQRVKVFNGPQQGVGRNFMYGLSHVPKTADYVAFCDQDDIWLPNKLSRAVRTLGELDKPCLYASRQLTCDANLRVMFKSYRPTKTPIFANTIIQNKLAGNTMVLNKAGLGVLQKADPTGVAFHDWFTSQMILGAGGRIVFDDTSSVLYRQHGHNMIGARRGLYGLGRRIKRLIKRQQAAIIRQHTHALDRNRMLFTQAARQTLDIWKSTQEMPRYQQRRTLISASICPDGVGGRLAFNATVLSGLLRPPAKVREMPLAICKAASKDS